MLYIINNPEEGKGQKLLKHHKSTSPSKIAPASKVYELVEELVQYLPEEIKERFE